MTPFIEICKSCLNLLPYSEGNKFIIIADKLMKFAGHLAMAVLFKGCGKNLENIGGQRVVKSDKCMGVSQLLGGHVPGLPPPKSMPMCNTYMHAYWATHTH